MRNLFRKTGFAFAGIAAAATLAFGAGNAAASQDGPYVENSNGSASAWFQANGDTFWVGDWMADSHTTAAVWAVSVPCGGLNPPCPNFARNNEGANTGVPVKYDLSENLPLRYRACTLEKGALVSGGCSDLRSAIS
ncbi:hypothetical protein H1V43_26120 [Streptomyces sp. PSKA54]|uniref:Secreted protein n=1 Tax=Streptomyces himalayensis subsp. aureolus TaxID=2758039 RepID=A0A7W2HI75_9ACTN|nr:hypothetical protein [Streptomyces himalayensis]MBA4864765.1 hypothetical protein [Streptomyces himalayensis subsp. aureolus]